MGNASYSSESRSMRATSLGYMSNSIDQNFTQNRKREAHELMSPKGIRLREARDSVAHPHTVPIIFALDVTGSMGFIPQYLVREGLPKIMAGIIQRGVPDPALLFLAVGDTICDRYPLQVGQFESGDEELDMWLTRTYLEGGGGSNAGESYLLAWYFASQHTATDAWNKRKEKGFIFTIGDEPSLRSLSTREIEGVMGVGGQTNYTDKQLLEAAQEKWNVYHLHMMEGSAGRSSLGYWKDLLGQNCVQIDHQDAVAAKLIEIITQHSTHRSAGEPTQASSAASPNTGTSTKDDIIL